METRSFIKIILFIATFHIVIVGLFLSIPMFCSQPQGQYVGTIFFSNAIINDMEKKRVTVEEINYTLNEGRCYHACLGGLLYVDELSKLGQRGLRNGELPCLLY